MHGRLACFMPSRTISQPNALLGFVDAKRQATRQAMMHGTEEARASLLISVARCRHICRGRAGDDAP